MRTANASLLLALSFAGGCLVDTSDNSTTTITTARLRGAIFTTLVDGSAVNHNIYDAKEDVYLDGGPGDGAPQHAAVLPDGDYYFQVTDPSGKVLLSSDAITCRRFTVSAGIIVSNTASDPGCRHNTGVDQDHNAVTVQLMPYDDTPNPGGEYKAWVTRVGDYNPSKKFHGFIESKSKTDNYKVRVKPYCGDGNLDAGEQCDDGNNVNDDGCSATCEIENPPPPPICGDGVVNQESEQCDDGNTVSGDGCDANCQIEYPPPPPCCGDGHVDAGEQCDDGNTVSGDGCDANCQIEYPPPPPCCGDGHLDDGEQCDDGNTVNGDGCSSTCTIEVVCVGLPRQHTDF